MQISIDFNCPFCYQPNQRSKVTKNQLELCAKNRAKRKRNGCARVQLLRTVNFFCERALFRTVVSNRISWAKECSFAAKFQDCQTKITCTTDVRFIHAREVVNKGSYLKTPSWFYPVIRFIIVEDIIRYYHRNHIGFYLSYWKVNKSVLQSFIGCISLLLFHLVNQCWKIKSIKCLLVKGFKVSLEKMLVNWKGLSKSYEVSRIQTWMSWTARGKLLQLQLKINLSLMRWGRNLNFVYPNTCLMIICPEDNIKTNKPDLT